MTKPTWPEWIDLANHNDTKNATPRPRDSDICKGPGGARSEFPDVLTTGTHYVLEVTVTAPDGRRFTITEARHESIVGAALGGPAEFVRANLREMVTRVVHTWSTDRTKSR